MNNRRSALFSIVILVALIVCAVGLGYFATTHKWSVFQPAVVTEPGYYKVTEFIDGDTIAVDMDGANEKVRMIGVDTPETHDPRKAVQCFGQAASDFTRNIIGQSSVRLEADPINSSRDRYDRLLRYVYTRDGTLINAEIIKQGYGFAYLGFPFTKSDEFRGYQSRARAESKGLWASCHPSENQYGGFTSDNASN